MAKADFRQQVIAGLTVVATALTLQFAGVVVFRSPGDFIPWADDYVYNATSFTAAWIVGLRSCAGGAQRRAWALLAFGLLLYWAGDVWWSFQGRARVEPLWLPFEDVLWLAFYPCVFVSIWLLAGEAPRRERAFIDGLVLGSGAFVALLLLLHYGWRELGSSSATATVVLKGLYVGLDFVLIAICCLLLVVQRFRPERGWLLLLLGFMAIAASDTVYWFQVARHRYVEGSWVDIGWLLGTTTVAWSAVLGIKPLPAIQVLSIRGMLPATLALLVSAWALDLGPEGPLGTIARLGAVVTLLVSILRLNYAIEDAAEALMQRRRALTDQITGLPNRQALSLLAQERPRDLSSSAGWAMLILGLDRFRDINSTLDHECGDRLIQQVARRLGGVIEPSDTLIRLDGDEFAVLMRSRHPGGALAAAHTLAQALELPLRIEHMSVVLTACVGVSAASDALAPVGRLLKEADIALRQAKSEGSGLIRAFAGQSSEVTRQQLTMRADLRADLRAGGRGFVLRFQPIVRTRDGTVLACEALLRWQQGGRLVQPGEFLPEVRRAGLMAELTSMVLCRALGMMQGLGQPHAVTVNVPPELLSDWLVEQTRQALRQTGAPADRLIIEVTEDALIRDPATANRVMRLLRADGVRILLDDFGSGWCGLSAVRDLAVDGLKIDRAFVSRIHSDKPTREITASVVALGRSLGLLVIGEGVEDENEKAVLDQIGVDYLQGYALCMPMDVEDLRHYRASPSCPAALPGAPATEVAAALSQRVLVGAA